MRVDAEHSNDPTAQRRRLRIRRRWLALTLTALAFVIAAPGTVSAHPLGNFSVNRLNQLTFRPDAIVNDAIVDAAEIPTQQASRAVDSDGDGVASPSERSTHAQQQCAVLAEQSTLTVDGQRILWSVAAASFEYSPGQAGLDTSRLECRLVAPVELAEQQTIVFTDDNETDRVGWAEINATGDGATIVGSPVPETSVTDRLTSYPQDLLESPLDVRDATFTVRLGADPAAMPTASAAEASGARDDTASAARDDVANSQAAFVPGVLDRVQQRFDDMIGQRDLTLGVGLLAVGLALVLGASHALLPGHGKTVMAAYIAGRQGSVRDAVTVGATVTATHTGGVLLLGLALTVSTALAGEAVIGWLGVISGAIVAFLGLALLIGAIRHRGDGLFAHGHTHAVRLPVVAQPALVGAATTSVGGVGGHSAHQAHDHHDPFSHADHDHHDHEHDHHDHDHHDHDHDHHDHHHRRHVSRRGLIGMGIAGGLVPSPSALIILLSAIALGRTWFGIMLVAGYGVGMAATLTAAGILLVRVRDRFQARAGRATGRARRYARRWTIAMPYATATLVLLVGTGLALRSLAVI